VPAFVRRRRTLALGAILVVVLAGLSVAAVRSRTPGCAVAAPDNPLPEQLRTLGEFNQPYEAGDLRGPVDGAVHAATALHSDLAGARPDQPVSIPAAQPAVYDALVVPLSETNGAPAGIRRVVGLAVFLEDCSGRAYFSDVVDLLHVDPSILPARFPTLTADQARAQLGARTVRLVYRSTPVQPVWEDPSTLRSVVAGPPIV
jgi:hypothetical protein